MPLPAGFRSKQVANDGISFLVRSLNDATACNVEMRLHNVFRPTLTNDALIDRNTMDVAEQLSKFAAQLSPEQLDELSVGSVCALLSTTLSITWKTTVVKVCVKWMRNFRVEGSIRDSLLQSLVIPDIQFQKVAVIRMAIHTYLSSPFFFQNFDIWLNRHGSVVLQRNEHSIITWNEQQLETFQKIIRESTKRFENPLWTGKTRLHGHCSDKRRKNFAGYDYTRLQNRLENPLFEMKFETENSTWKENRIDEISVENAPIEPEINVESQESTWQPIPAHWKVPEQRMDWSWIPSSPQRSSSNLQSSSSSGFFSQESEKRTYEWVENSVKRQPDVSASNSEKTASECEEKTSESAEKDDSKVIPPTLRAPGALKTARIANTNDRKNRLDCTNFQQKNTEKQWNRDEFRSKVDLRLNWNKNRNEDASSTRNNFLRTRIQVKQNRDSDCVKTEGHFLAEQRDVFQRNFEKSKSSKVLAMERELESMMARLKSQCPPGYHSAYHSMKTFF